MAEKMGRNSSSEAAVTASNKGVSLEQRQLHKVIKIKYKDGTVAFKSVSMPFLYDTIRYDTMRCDKTRRDETNERAS